jgi:hypothetical protein
MLIVHSVPAFSQSAAPGCFCLRNTDGSLIRGCERETQGPSDAYPTAVCKTAKQEIVMRAITPGWSKVPAGTPPCDPCPTSSTTPMIPERPRAPE